QMCDSDLAQVVAAIHTGAADRRRQRHAEHENAESRAHDRASKQARRHGPVRQRRKRAPSKIVIAAPGEESLSLVAYEKALRSKPSSPARKSVACSSATRSPDPESASRNTSPSTRSPVVTRLKKSGPIRRTTPRRQRWRMMPRTPTPARRLLMGRWMLG